MVNSLPLGVILLHFERFETNVFCVLEFFEASFFLGSECFEANIPHVLVIVEGILFACMHLEVAMLKGDETGAILLSLNLILDPTLPGNGAQSVVLTLDLDPGLFCALDSPLQCRRGGQISRQGVLHLPD